MIDKVLEERGSRYGEYKDIAVTTQLIKNLYGDRNKYEYTTIESLDMIASKLARIIHGDKDYEDNWIDIIGYAQLELDAIRYRTDTTEDATEIENHEVHPMAEPQIETVTLLSEFLKGNGCYDKFVENFDKEYDKEWKTFINYAIVSAFDWLSSLQGFGYWQGINDKWKSIPNQSKENDMLFLLDEDTLEEYQHSGIQSGEL